MTQTQQQSPKQHERDINRSRDFLTEECLNMGTNAQNDFIELCKKQEWKVTRTKADERSATYIQMYVQREGGFKLDSGQKEVVSVKVRSMTKLKRANKLPQDRWVCIELHGAEKDEAGWLVGGRWDLLAVQYRRGFIMVERYKLIELISRCVDRKSASKHPEDSKYILYGRKHRCDVITHIRRELLNYILMGTVFYPEPLENVEDDIG